ncbi:MAG: sensor histidine kinase [Deltaproteobacteria bacterium]|nr:MAG: sensor histidine kinase [Deltaproteobacteria bacterium]
MNQLDQPPRSMAPWAAALLLSLSYIVVGAAYIFMSSRLVTNLADSVLQAGTIEIIKGLSFVGATGLGLFLATWWGLRLRERLVDEILQWREATAATERQAIAATLAGSVAHDINNVLMILSAKANASDDDFQAGIERLTSLARNLQRLSQPQGQTSIQDIELSVAVRAAVKFARSHERLQGRKIDIECQHDRVLALPLTLLDRALLNMLLNGGEATRQGGRLLVSCGSQGDEIFLCVEDDGPGFPDGKAEALLEPGQTTRERGSGLGLMTVTALADRLGGGVSIGRSERLGGAKVEIRWPAEGL